MLLYNSVSAALVFLAPPVFALKQVVVSSFIYTRYGDRTPLYTSENVELTPYGAQQMYKAGSNFRNRYLNGGDFGIWQISPDTIQSEQLDILSNSNQWTVASAQAFMQGLYPPTADLPNTTQSDLLSGNELANGATVVAPLGGYQYSSIQVASGNDVNSVYVNGGANCPASVAAMLEFYNSSTYTQLQEMSEVFYDGLEDDFLQGAFNPKVLGFFDSYYIYDYMQYQYLHNSTFYNRISEVNMTKAEVLAADWIFAMYSNQSSSLQSIAGSGLAAGILSSFSDAIRTQGVSNKMNMYFGDLVPMVSFAALSGLSSAQSTSFWSIPPYASSYIFELVALVDDNANVTEFPSTDNLFVQFYYQNGTDEYSQLSQYSLFGLSPSLSLIRYSDFVNMMSDFSISNPGVWCQLCESKNIFCPAYEVTTSLGGNSRKGLSPVIAGVIGALVSLVVAGLAFVLAMLLGGVRLHRQERKGKSSLGGFKGSQKLASDQDLTIAKGGAGATVITTEPDASRGHERTGSWELRQKEVNRGAATPRRPSFEDDEIQVSPHATGVRPHEAV